MECKLWLLGTSAMKPDIRQAWAVRDSLLKHSAAGDTAYASINSLALVAGAIGRAGLKDSAAHVLARVDDRPDIDPTLDATQAKAIVFAQIGDKDNAIKALARYLSANPARAIGFDDEHSWLWRSIHDDPRFQALVVKARK